MAKKVKAPQPKVRQWQCPCGAWLDMDRARHIHPTQRQPTLAEMVLARDAGADGAALNTAVDIAAVSWSPDFPRRDKPNE